MTETARLHPCWHIRTTHIHVPSWQAQHDLHEPIIINLNPPITVGVVTLERLSDLLDDDARAYESVKRDARERTPGVRHGRRVLALNEFNEARREAISEMRSAPWSTQRGKRQYTYPNCVSASLSSPASIVPDRSRSKCRKRFCQS